MVDIVNRATQSRMSNRLNRNAVGVVLVMMALAAVLLIWSEASRVESELHQRGETNAGLLSRASVDPLLTSKWLTLDELVENARRSESDVLLYAYVTDSTGAPRTSPMASMNWEHPAVRDVQQSHATFAEQIRALDVQPSTMVVSRPVTIESRSLGTVHIGLSREKARAQATRTSLFFLGAAATIAAALAIVVSITFRRIVTRFNEMGTELERARDELAIKQQNERELAIAARVQTLVLPRRPAIDSLAISCRMIPAAEVGGDFYDVISDGARGGWILIGDVAGHGLVAGLEMLMTQSAMSANILSHPDSSPAQILSNVDKVLWENIHNRLNRDEYVTASLLRYRSDGQVTVAGAHQDILVYRAASLKCETIVTPGCWLGMGDDTGSLMTDLEFVLDEGDVMVLYTDGITEAPNAAGELFGLHRLRDKLVSSAAASVDEIRDGVLDDVRKWMGEQRDDITMVVVRRERTRAARERAPVPARGGVVEQMSA